MTQKANTLTTLTNTVIKHKTPELAEIPDDDAGERCERAMDITEAIIDSYVSQLSFVETMIFAETLCNEYDVARAFPPKQREDPLSFVDDWREAATGGLYHLILDAVRKEAVNNQHGYTRYETFGNQNIAENPIQDSEDNCIKTEAVYTEADPNLYRIIEYNPDQIEAIGDQIIADVIDTGESPSLPASIEKLLNSDLIIKALVINYITDETDFQRWEAMSDTACRENFAYTEFTAVIGTVISEFEAFYDPDNEHTLPDNLQE